MTNVNCPAKVINILVTKTIEVYAALFSTEISDKNLAIPLKMNKCSNSSKTFSKTDRERSLENIKI